MTPSPQSSDAKRLAAIRDRLRALGLGETPGWSIGYDGTERVIVDAEGEIIFRVPPGATQDEFELAAHAPGDIAFLLGLIERATARIRELQDTLTAFRNAHPLRGEARGANKNYAAEAAIKAGDLTFRLFLRWHPDAQPVGGASGDRDPVELATDRLRAILGIASRKELNDRPEAAQRWVDLKAEYDSFRAMPDAVRAAQYPGYDREMSEGHGGPTSGLPLTGGAEGVR